MLSKSLFVLFTFLFVNRRKQRDFSKENENSLNLFFDKLEERESLLANKE
jgi:hypothetical protein